MLELVSQLATLRFFFFFENSVGATNSETISGRKLSGTSAILSRSPESLAHAARPWARALLALPTLLILYEENDDGFFDV